VGIARVRGGHRLDPHRGLTPHPTPAPGRLPGKEDVMAGMLFGEILNTAAGGAYLFLLASFAFVFGTIKYRPIIFVEDVAEEKGESHGKSNS
jgi:hypothetical protein